MLSNLVYLIVVKILTNRLREVLPDLVSLVQSTFIRGKSLQESFILAMEMLVLWNRRRSKGLLCKVHFAKAYDLVVEMAVAVALTERTSTYCSLQQAHIIGIGIGMPPVWSACYWYGRHAGETPDF
jgi:hypothetical protein